MMQTVGRLSLACVLATSLFSLGAGALPGAGGSAPTAAAAATSSYVPVAPCRLADERTGLGFVEVNATTRRVGVDACGIPAAATSIIVSTTIANPRTNGWLVTYPSATPRPLAATLNWRAGQTRANTAIVSIGPDRHVAVGRSSGFGDGSVIIDVVGAFVAASASTSGRFQPLPTARRLLDTRVGARIATGNSVTLPLPDSVPADAAALAINITSVRNTVHGFITAHPAGSQRPATSVLNADRPNQSRAAATIVPVTPDGITIYTDMATHLIVDVTGWFTGESAAESADGLFVPVKPGRLRDTRPERSPIHPGGTIEVVIPSVARDAAAVAFSTTMIRPDERNYITAHAGGTPRGATSSGLGERDDITAQFGISATSARGLAIFANTGTEITADLLGYFTGTPATITSTAPAVNPAPLQHVIAIGDSALAGIDRNRAWAQLRGADIDLRARSCRRLVRTSCNGREGPIPPPNALQELWSLPAGHFDVAIIMTGYNDGASSIAAGIPAILAAARAKGIRRIVWMTHARELRSDKGGAAPGKQVYGPHNAAIRNAAAQNVDMVAMEWSAVTRRAPFWLYADGIHLDKYGGHGAADFISRAVANVTGQACPMPQYPGATNVGVCPDPGTMPPVDIARLYGI